MREIFRKTNISYPLIHARKYFCLFLQFLYFKKFKIYGLLVTKNIKINYSSIALFMRLPCFSKLLNIFINKRVYNLLTEKKSLYNNRYGYLKATFNRARHSPINTKFSDLKTKKENHFIFLFWAYCFRF